MTPLTVTTDLAVLATLPARFRVGDPADVTVVDGTSPDWPSLVAVARAALVVTPTPVDPARVRETAAAGVPAAVDSPYANNPAWTAALPALTATPFTLLDSVVTVAAAADLDRALLDQLAIVRPLLDTSDLDVTANRGTDHYVIAGRCGDAAVTIAGVVAAEVAGELRLDLVGIEERWAVRFEPPQTARPASITRSDANGSHTTRPVFESGRRAVWRHLATALAGGDPPPYGLTEYAADLDFAARIGLLLAEPPK
jgi:hypothetical protein